MVVSSLPAWISFSVIAFISARVEHSKWLHSETVCVQPHWQIIPSPIDFTVGLAAPAKFAALSITTNIKPGIGLEDTVFLHGLFALTLDLRHFTLHTAGHHGQQSAKEHHNPADPNPFYERIHKDLHDGFVGIGIRARHYHVKVFHQ